VRRNRLDLVVYVALATIAFAVSAFAFPGDRTIELHVYVLVLGAMLMAAVVAAVGGALPRGRRSQLTLALRAQSQRDEPVRDLERMERVVTLAVASAHDLHTRLLPILRDIAAARLERAGKRPGPETLGRWWPLLRPDRPAPTERFEAGIAPADLRALVADLERMA
jgi:hypothetical protein